MAIVKIIDKGQKMPMMLKLKFIRNKATLDIMNNKRETIIFDNKTSIGILDLRSLGYCCVTKEWMIVCNRVKDDCNIFQLRLILFVVYNYVERK